MNAADLADRLALRELADAYARCADLADGPGLAELFEPDGELLVRRPGESAPSTTLRGRDEIAAAIGRLVRYAATFHLVANHYPSLAGVAATAVVYCLAPHATADGRDHVMVIRYQDRCRRGPAGWRFERRELFVDWTEARAVTSVLSPRRAAGGDGR